MNLLRSVSDEVAAIVHRARPAVLHLRRLAQGQTTGSGSGFVCGPGGLGLTNHHVVAGADAIEATLHDGRSLLVDVVGVDPATDLAVIRLGGDDLPFLELADSTALRVGDFAIAVGCPHGLMHSVTAGIVSGLGRSLASRTGRTIEDIVQTDAPLNPGNSGGPLLDHEGRVVGIATAIVQHAQGLCFAVPSATALAVIPELLAHGSVLRGWLGLAIETVEVPTALVQRLQLGQARVLAVAGVRPGSPAATAGLLTGDLLLRLGDRPLRAAGDLYRGLDRESIGRPLGLRIARGTELRELTVTPIRLPQAA